MKNKNRVRSLVLGVLALLFINLQPARADQIVYAQPTDALSCGALAEIVVLAVYYAPEIGAATGSTIGAVHAQLAAALGVSTETVEGYALILTALGVAAGHHLELEPAIWFHRSLDYVVEHSLAPMWQGCVRVWDQYRQLPGDVGTLYTNWTGNGANDVALRGNLSEAMATGKQCLADNAGRFGTLMGHFGISYKAWRACRGCCDDRIRDDRFRSGDSGRADFFRSAPAWGSCMAVCNGLPHANGDARYLE